MEILKFKTTEGEQAVGITKILEKVVSQSRVSEGALVVYCPHTTAGIAINEGTDETFVLDLFSFLEVHVSKIPLTHPSNPKAHLKAAIIGNSKSIPISDGKLALGTWESVFLLDFDGPKERNVFVQVIGKIG